MKGKKVTAKDVAERAGVSTATVSMILNGTGTTRFPNATCRRVIEACTELGYVRHNTLRSNMDDNKMLVAITPSMTNLYYVHMLETMERRAMELGYSLFCFNTFRAVQQETRIMQLCSQYPFAGVVLLYPPENEMLLQLVGWSKPTVHIYDKGVHDSADVLELDSFHIGRIIGEHLYELGHQRIAFITSTFNTRQVARVRRLEGLREVYASRGLDAEQCVSIFSPESENIKSGLPMEGYELGYIIAKRLVERGENVTAFVGNNDMIAFGIMDALIDCGKKIPEDYSVCGSDNVSVSKYKSIALTTVENYARQTGREAIDILTRRIEGGSNLHEFDDAPDGITKVEYFPKLIARNSSGPCKKTR